METKPICIRCQHYLPPSPVVAMARCGKVRLFDGVSPVTGEPYFEACAVARSTFLDWNDKPMCGPEGRWFEAKNITYANDIKIP